MRFIQLVLPLVLLVTLASRSQAASFPADKPTTVQQLLAKDSLVHGSKTRKAPKATSRPAPRAPSRPAPRATSTRQKTTVCCPRCSTCRARAARNGVRVK